MEIVSVEDWLDGSDVDRDTEGRPVNGAGFSSTVRELAFELYYTDAGRNLSAVQSLLAADPYNVSVHVRTLTRWRRSDNWDLAADQRLSAFAPHRRRRTAEGLTVAAEMAANYLVRVLSGTEKATKEQIAACKLALDSSGFASVRSLDPPALGDLALLGDGSGNNGGDGGASGAPMEMTVEAALERIKARREAQRFVGEDDT